MYGLLISYAWGKRQCYPSHSTLAAHIGSNVRTVYRHLQELQARGLIAIDQQGLTRPNVYELKPVEPLVALDRTNLSGQERTDLTHQERTNLTGQDRTKTSSKEYPTTKNQNNSRRAAVPSPPAQQIGGPDQVALPQILAAIAALVPGADVSAVPSWVAQYGAEHVAERVRWLRAELAAGATIESPMGWLYRMLTVAEPPLTYRRQLEAQEREARQRAQRAQEAERREQETAQRQRDLTWRAELRHTWECLPAGQRIEIDRRAREAVLPTVGEVPSLPAAWESGGPAAALWRQAIRDMMGAPAPD